MKAFVKDRYGSPDVLQLQEVDKPELSGPDAILVRVRATALNAHDWHMLRGKPYLARLTEGFRRPKERQLGLDVAGIAEEVGANVTDVRPGDAVYGSRWGAFAEYVSSRNMVPMPGGLTFEEAAAIPTAGMTALQGLRDRGALEAGQQVLINGAGGGVGTFAVQIAAALGGEVTAVTSTKNVEMVRSIGATEVIDYTREDFTRGSRRYDLILDIGGNRRLSAMRRALTPTGRIVMVAPQPGQWIGPIARDRRRGHHDAAREPAGGRVPRGRQPGRSARPEGPHRGGQAEAGHRSDVSVRPDPGGHPVRRVRGGRGQGRHRM